MASETKIKPQGFRLDKRGAEEPPREMFTLEPVEDFVEAEAAAAAAPVDPAERAVEFGAEPRHHPQQSRLLGRPVLFRRRRFCPGCSGQLADSR